MTSDVSLPTRNPLHSIPSLHHQSSTQSKLEHSNVNYNDFDIDYSTPESLADQPLNNGDAIQVPVIEKCSFQQNTIRLLPDIAFQVHLMSQMNEHRGNDLNMFNEIITCIKKHAVHHAVDYTTLQILSQKQLVELLTRYYRLDFLKPILRTITLSNGTLATMTIFDVKALLIAFLNDMLIMREETLHQIMTYFQERQSRPGLLLMKSTRDHCGSQRNKNIVLMIQTHFLLDWHVFITRQIRMS
jgi:hypothetical protein